jgi:hypothetical protein
MGQGLAIREDVATAAELRRLAKKEPRRRTAQRMLAIANALEGMSRAQAARPGSSGSRCAMRWCGSTSRGSAAWWTVRTVTGRRS